MQFPTVQAATASLYPEGKIFDSGQLKVTKDASIYYEQRGNPKGPAVVLNHGGPGGASSPDKSRWFDPSYYRIILYDQRGTGKSIPSVRNRETNPALFQNLTVQDMVSDLEKLREHLKISQWIVFGGSWGSTLSLAYAETHPDKIKGLVVYGIFLNQPAEMTEYYDFEMIKKRFPKLGKKALATLYDYVHAKNYPIKANDVYGLIQAFYELCVLKNDPAAQYLWTAYENFNDSPSLKTLAALHHYPDKKSIDPSDKSHAIFETMIFRYAYQGFDVLNPALLSRLKNTDVRIIQGMEDTEAPPVFALKLIAALKNLKQPFHYELIKDGKHNGDSSSSMEQTLVKNMDSFKFSPDKRIV
jgi:proline iminopeptidase